jgi:uncharacterized protein
MKVAITGATGFVGSRLVERLQSEGHEAIVLTRNPERALKVFPAAAFPNVEVVGYTPTDLDDWQHVLSGCDGVVNLAGEPIAEHRWTAERKQMILDSRKLGTQTLVAAIAQATPKPTVLVNASAIGYYGTSETATFDETSPAGDDFLAEICQIWEAEAQKVKQAGLRLVIVRLGIVLGDGGALAKMIPPFKLFAGGPIGTGKQWFSWIHREDLVSLILQSLTDSAFEGVYNATAPNPVRMTELAHTLGAKVVLEGQQVLPKRTEASGFQYQYSTITQALTEILQ